MMLAVSLATGLLIAPPVSPGASRRVTKMRMAYTGERIALGTHVATLEGRCDSGDDSACTMLDQLAGYAKALEDLNGRRVRAPDAPLIQNESMLRPTTAADAQVIKNELSLSDDATLAAAPATSVTGALVRLFDAFDSDACGYITLKTLQASWRAGRKGIEHRYTSGSTRDAKWEVRQARAGSRRLARLFSSSAAGNGGKVSRDEFVAALKSEYEKRMERGLSNSGAVAEIVCNMPQRALFTEMYGSE